LAVPTTSWPSRVRSVTSSSSAPASLSAITSRTQSVLRRRPTARAPELAGPRGSGEELGDQLASRLERPGHGLPRLVELAQVQGQIGDGQALHDVVVDLEGVPAAHVDLGQTALVLLVLALLGEVAGHLGEAAQLPVLAAQGSEDDQGPEAGAVLAQPPALLFDAAAGRRLLQLSLGEAGVNLL